MLRWMSPSGRGCIAALLLWFHGEGLGFQHRAKQAAILDIQHSRFFPSAVLLEQMRCSSYSGCEKRGRPASEDFEMSLFVNKTTQSPALMQKSPSFPVTHAKDPLAGIPAPPCSLGHKSFFNLFSHLHVRTPTPPNLWKIPSWKKSAQSRLERSTFPLAKPIKRTSLASKAWITG